MNVLFRLNRPWLHFIALGSLLFSLQGRFFPQSRPVLGPLAEARIEALQQQWLASVGRLPTAEQLTYRVEAELDRDMLFQRAIELDLHLYDPVVYQRLLLNMRFLQLGKGKSDGELYQTALEMRLHLGDELIKRRLIQVMEQRLLAENPLQEPTEAEIAAEFAQRRAELGEPPRYSIQHIYFHDEREAEAPAVIAKIQQENLSPEQARQFSSPFLSGYEFTAQTPERLARHFGMSFVDNLQAQDPQAGHWVGPVRSTFGLHYVWVSALAPPADA
ncbi:MAG: peptidylprolyl isomerase, partial [Chromatocurvus sp.]